MDMDRYSAPLRVVLNIATLKAYVIHNWAKSEFDLMQMPWRNLGSSEIEKQSEIGFCASPACTVVLLSSVPNIHLRIIRLPEYSRIIHE